MKQMVITFLLSFIISFNANESYGFPYSSNEEIQVYSEVPGSFLSSFARTCIEEAKKKGVMSQLNEQIGCSNLPTAEKVCSCVDRTFKKDKVDEFIASEEAKKISNLIDKDIILDESSISPNRYFSRKIQDLNLNYKKLGLTGCTLDSTDKYNSHFIDKKTNKKISEDQTLKQNVLFNLELKLLETKEPSKEQLLDISKKIAEKSGVSFPLEKILIQSSRGDNSLSKASSIVKDSIVSDYIKIHLDHIAKGEPSSKFDINKTKSSRDVKYRRKGCDQILSLIALQKKEDIQKQIKKGLEKFYPDSFINQSKNQSDKNKRTEKVKKSINEMNNLLNLTGFLEYEKDIYYCNRYNEFKSRSEQMTKNEVLKDSMAKLKDFRENDLIAAMSSSQSEDDPAVKVVRKKISNLEDEIKKKFNLSDEALQYAYTSLKIWEVDQGVDAEVNDGVVTYNEVDTERSLSEKMQRKSTRFERSRERIFASISSDQGATSLSVASKTSTSASVNYKTEVESNVIKPSVSSSVKVTPKEDNYFNRATNISNNIEKRSNNSSSIKNASSANPYEKSGEYALGNSVIERVNKLKQDKSNTEEQLRSELASTKESLEISKLREELRKQSEEISKLTASKDEIPTAAISKKSDNSSNVSFKSRLASAIDSSVISNSSDESGNRAVDSVNNRAVASSSNSSFAEQASSGASSSASAASSISNSGPSNDESSSVSGISLSSLKNISEDFQVIEGESLGEVKPILIEESFVELNEEEKKLRIEELLETTIEDEVYIEFPDGKVLKFSKKDEDKIKDDKKKEDLTKSKIGEMPDKPIAAPEGSVERTIFSYDNLKELIDSNK